MTNKKRREWWILPSPSGLGLHRILDWNVASYFHVREVLPDDPDPEWVDELIAICKEAERSHIGLQGWMIGRIREHLAKRCEQ